MYLVVCSPITSNHLIQRIASAQVFRGSPATSKAGQETSVNLSALSPPRMVPVAQLAAQEIAILHKSSFNVSGGSSSHADKAVAKKIVYYKGKHLPTGPILHYFNFNSRSLCGGYKCTVEYVYNETLTENADMVVFKHMLERTPPKKQKNQLWTFQTVESQTSTRYCDTKAWEGLFNYSISPIRLSVSNQHDVCMSTRPVRRDHLLKENHYKTKLSMTNGSEANALWSVSNCRLSVQSQRNEHALSLSRYVNVQVYTRAGRCKTQLKPILGSNGGTKASYNGYWFYLAFENSLCRDYITEKFRKIITSDSLTIPVVLGGYSMEDYEIVAPPKSYIDVRNFTSAKHLAEHLKYVTENEHAFNYYQQWRNEYLIPKYDQPIGN